MIKYHDYIWHPALSGAFAKLRKGPQAGLANLFTHQYQVAITAFTSQHVDDVPVASPDCFTWIWTKPPSCDLEILAREVYSKAVEAQYNHAIVHIAVSGLARLSRLVEDPPWDLDNTAAYTVLIPKESNND
jgi:hypothetical protein